MVVRSKFVTSLFLLWFKKTMIDAMIVKEPLFLQVLILIWYEHKGPEVSFCLKEGYSAKPIDIWSIGVCIYAFLTETLPFNGESDIEVQINSKDKDFEIPDYLTKETTDILQSLLNKDPKKRPTVKNLLENPWFVI